ncbi:unnamed protein product [Schistosoma curassoni]|uniref:RRM domain-containing protein n=1 Tax=Schistosoma curassoni TaxID=6186 RepID=A0A183K064_9TREM|nr:unnamed protein product [Schistosoma curassoni]
MRRYNLAVLGISETYWTEAEQQRLGIEEVLLYSDHEEENSSHTQGVALMLSKEARSALIEWEFHGSRIVKVSFKTKKEEIIMIIIQCDAPINDSNYDDKDQFYDGLQSIIVKCPRRNLTIQKEDLDPEVGMGINSYEDIMGQNGLGERNENRKRFANLCAFKKLVIGGKIFPHKSIHKATWVSSNHTTENQINYMCISKRFTRLMEDVRTRRRANIATDHRYGKPAKDLRKEEQEDSN